MLVAMKKLTLYALKENRDAILLALQKDGNAMFVAEDEKAAALPGAEQAANNLEKAGEALRFVSLHTGKKPLFIAKNALAYQKFMTTSEEGRKLTERLDTLANRIYSLHNEGITMLGQAEALTPWLALDIPLEKLAPTESSVCYAGYLAEEELEGFKKDVKELLVEIIPLQVAQEGRAIVVFAHKDAAQEVKHFLKEHDFSDALFPQKMGLASEVAKELKQEAAAKQEEAAACEQEARELSAQKAAIELYYDQQATLQERLANGGAETEKTFCLNGWVRHDRTQQVEAAVKSVTEAYQLEFYEPAEGEVPPTVLDNGPLIRPFESVLELYSLPKAGSVDPDFLMAPFHFIFFGMMVSDAGYGLVLTIMLFIALKVFKPEGFAGKLAMVIFFGSISTVFWGAMFGGWFGLEWHPLLFVPMNEPLKMLALCFGLGAIHLTCGMLLKCYLLIRDGDVEGAICDVLSWLIMFAGFLCMLLLPQVPVGKYLALLGAGIIILFGARDKKNPIRRLLGGLLTLYNISSYLSDLLSYSRLFALGLATGVIAMVINTVAQMLMQAGPIGAIVAVLVLLGGHYFNIVINVLGAFVHSSRLQYIEFFGKFYETGGRAFLPLAFRTKYTNVTK